MGKITYCIIDETDPRDEFECEGEVIRTFFSTSPKFDLKNSRAYIRPKRDIVNKLMNDSQSLLNIFHFSAHGAYHQRKKKELDYSCIYRKRGNQWVEIFRPDTIVRVNLRAEVFLSTCCQTFNDYFIEIIFGYGGIANFIAPQNTPFIRDTTIFSLMFYNELLNRITSSQKVMKPRAVIDSFKITNKAYKAYKGEGRFLLYNLLKKNKIYE